MAIVDPRTYSIVVNILRNFFLDKGFVEVEAQSQCSILAACEDPKTVTTYSIQGEVWPSHQTNQMHLEGYLLSDPSLKGCFCVTTSYRDEPNPVPGRHERIFPMFEFESHGDMDALKAMETEFLMALGFPAPFTVTYEELCQKFDTRLLEHEHETMLWEQMGTCALLEWFPQRSDPFWNMRRDTKDPEVSKKVDIILYGMETCGSAERSCDREVMRHDFHTVSNGGYAQLLYDKFGKARVEAELEEYLAYDFFPRFGGGIGMTRLMRAWKLLQAE